jgi:hypothetical protein
MHAHTIFPYLCIASFFTQEFFLREFRKRRKRAKRHKKVAQRQTFESGRAVLTSAVNEEASSVLVMPHDEADAR